MSIMHIPTAAEEDLRGHIQWLLGLAALIEGSPIPLVSKDESYQMRWVNRNLPYVKNVFDFMQQFEDHGRHFPTCIGEERGRTLVELVCAFLAKYERLCRGTRGNLPAFQFEPASRRAEVAQMLRESVDYMRIQHLRLPWPQSHEGGCCGL